MVLSRYQGPSANSVEVESDLFEGMKFSEYNMTLSVCDPKLTYSKVVSADPKSKTGEEDRKELMKMYELHGRCSCWTFAHSYQDLCERWKLYLGRDISTTYHGRLRRHYHAHVIPRSGEDAMLTGAH
jgi:hypothetical protein